MDQGFSLETGAFPDPLKLAEITPIDKKEDSFEKGNYQLIRILPWISKLSEKILYSQVHGLKSIH